MKKTLLLLLIFSGFHITANHLKTNTGKHNHTVNLKTNRVLSTWLENSTGKLSDDINTDKNVLPYSNNTAPLVVTATVQDVNCNGMANGSATVMPSGGTAPYSYLWSNGKTTASITGLAPGTYSCTVTDAASSSILLSVAITQPTPLISTTAITNPDCNGNHKGSLTITAIGGTAPYAYDIYTNGIVSQPSNVFNDLAAGIYQTYVRDSKSCIASNTIIINPTNTPPPTANTQTLNNTSTVANLQATGSNLKWYNEVSGGIALDLSVVLQTGKYYVSQTIDGCESTRTAVDVTINKIYTLIPDVKFENKLISLGIDSGIADGKVLTSKISSLASLNVSSSAINDLTGIQDFISLKSLMCENNKLTTLNVTQNIALTQLYCSQNQIATLDVSKNINLEDLQTGFNLLKQLDLSKNSSLTHLECYRNQLTALDLSQNKALNYLDCFSNQLVTLDLSQNKLLTIVYCYDNQLTSLNVTGLTALTDIDCPNNLLTNLDISTNTGLKGLHCYSNKLKSLDLSKNVALTDLICHSNELTYLNLKNGNNTNFVVSTYTKFTNNPNLTCIQVDNASYSNTNWANIKDATAYYSTDCTPAYTLIPDVNFENKLISLGIDSGVADGKVLTVNISSLTSLDVSKSNIADLTGIEDFITLNKLDCGNNKLSNLNISNNKLLTELICRYNNLTVLDLSANSNLTSLDCIYNQLTAIDVSNMPNLRSFLCNANQITQLNVTKNLFLDWFGCNGNKLTTLDISQNKLLVFVDCGFNQLSSLDVSNNKSLFYLNCYYNKLKSLDVSMLTELTNLSCSGSQFSNLDVSKNLKLKSLLCENINVTTIDVSKNTALQSLSCGNGNITTLDVSKNKALTQLHCYNNKLTYLNLKNGTNTLLTEVSFIQNPNLSCIQVDNATYSNTNWAILKDATANYSTDCNAAYTLIPNSNFEQKLIDLGIDIDGLNGKIFTANIASITTLDLSNAKITDLGGIENFTALKSFTANGNNLTSVDFSKNIMLEYISISGNNITNLDVSKNTNLSELDFSNNKVTQIDLSQNKELTVLNALGNQLTTLDISQNSKLKSLNIEFNQLKTLNLQNGNNVNFVLAKPTTKLSQAVVYTSFLNNPYLSCIKVDNVAYSNQNWSKIKDATAIYSATCSTLGIEDSVFDKVAIYPNPVKDELHIDNIVLKKATIYDSLGKLIKTTTFKSGTNDNTIHLNGFAKGVYYIYLESEGVNTAKKIIVE